MGLGVSRGERQLVLAHLRAVVVLYTVLFEEIDPFFGCLPPGGYIAHWFLAVAELGDLFERVIQDIPLLFDCHCRRVLVGVPVSLSSRIEYDRDWLTHADLSRGLHLSLWPFPSGTSRGSDRG